MKWFVNITLGFVKKYCSFPLPFSEMSLVHTMVKIMNIFFSPYRSEKPPKVGRDIEEILNNFILFSLIWSIGAATDENSRKPFHEFILKLVAG